METDECRRTHRSSPATRRCKERARAQARDVLARSDAFKAMPLDEQRSIYLSLVEEYIGKQRLQNGLSQPFATDSGKEMGYKGYDPGFSGDTTSVQGARGLRRLPASSSPTC